MRSIILLSFFSLSVLAFAGPETEAHGPSQNIADVLREAAGAEAGLIAAGMIKTGNDTDLGSFLRYPTDEVAVVELKGSQLRSALSRSVSLFPSPYDSFLQLSNMEATFRKSATPDNRLETVMLGGQKLDDSRTYKVAMPLTLARGGLGYFRIWDKKQITKTLDGVTLEDLMSGKKVTPSAPRWKVLS